MPWPSDAYLVRAVARDRVRLRCHILVEDELPSFVLFRRRLRLVGAHVPSEICRFRLRMAGFHVQKPRLDDDDAGDDDDDEGDGDGEDEGGDDDDEGDGDGDGEDERDDDNDE